MLAASSGLSALYRVECGSGFSIAWKLHIHCTSYSFTLHLYSFNTCFALAHFHRFEGGATSVPGFRHSAISVILGFRQVGISVIVPVIPEIRYVDFPGSSRPVPSRKLGSPVYALSCSFIVVPRSRKELVYASTVGLLHLVWNKMSWRIAFVKRSSPAIRNWRKSSLRRENLCRHTTSQWRWSESGAQTYTPRGPCASHSKDTLRGFHTCASLDQLVVLKLYLPQSIQSVNTKTLEHLFCAISNVSACLHHSFSIIWLKVRTCSSFY